MRWFTLPTVSRTGKLQPLDGAKILQMSSASVLVATVSWGKEKEAVFRICVMSVCWSWTFCKNKKGWFWKSNKLHEQCYLKYFIDCPNKDSYIPLEYNNHSHKTVAAVLIFVFNETITKQFKRLNSNR